VFHLVSRGRAEKVEVDDLSTCVDARIRAPSSDNLNLLLHALLQRLLQRSLHSRRIRLILHAGETSSIIG
jgi:hypothetical protein